MYPDPNRMFIPEVNPSRCPCNGSGWFLSDYDTWHECGTHFQGQPHPEDDCDSDFDFEAVSLENDREAYRYFQEQSGLSPREFRQAVENHLADEGIHRDDAERRERVNAADAVAEQVWRHKAEQDAQAQGYSCRLEAAMDAEASIEAHARHRNMDPEVYATRGSPERADADRWYR